MSSTPLTSANEYFRREGLVRPEDGRLLAGVCAGLGRRFVLVDSNAEAVEVMLGRLAGENAPNHFEEAAG
jgi:hypothetical protein